MSFPIKLAAASTLGIGGTVGAVCVGSKIMHSSNETSERNSLVETFEDKYRASLIKKDKNNQSKWDDRKVKLSKDQSTDLENGLKKIKGKKDFTGDDVREWCEEVVVQPYSGQDASKIKGIEGYCTYTIKDQIGEKLINETESYKVRGI